MSSDIVLKLVLKYLQENHYCQAMLALQKQSETNYHNYPKQIQFFRKIMLKGDFSEVVKFLLTFQSKIQQRQLRKLILEVYKQKLYQLIQQPNESQLKNLFEKQIINYCSQEQYQTYFTYLTCRNVQDIPGLMNWTTMSGRISCFQSILPTLQKLTAYAHKKQDTDMNLQTIVYDYMGKYSQAKPNKKSRHGKQSLQSINYKQQSQTYQIKQKSQLQSNRNEGANSKANRFKNPSSVQNSRQADIQLSESRYQKSNAFFEKKPRMYANLSSKPVRQENQLKYQDPMPIKSQTFKLNQYESSKMEQISQESQRSDRMKIESNHSKQTAKIKQSQTSQYLEQQAKKQINYLQQENSIVYKTQQNQNFTFSHHAQSQIRLKKITKLTSITDAKAIRTCQFSESGKYFALGTNSSFLKIFDVEELYGRNQPQKTIIPIYQIDNLHLKSIFCLNWSKNQKAIITCSNDLTIKITQFGQSMTNHRINVIGRHESCIRMVKFNGLQNKIISCGDDNLIKVWDISRIKKCTVLKGHQGNVSAFKLAQNQNQSIIYSVSKDSTIRKWDLRTGDCQLTSNYQQSELTYIANNIDRIVVTHKNGTVSFFNNSLQLDHSVQIHEQQIRSIDGLEQDGTLLTASFDGHVGIFNEKSILSPVYHLHNENQQDKVVFATFLQSPSINGFASTSTLGLCHLYSYQ